MQYIMFPVQTQQQQAAAASTTYRLWYSLRDNKTHLYIISSACSIGTQWRRPTLCVLNLMIYVVVSC